MLNIINDIERAFMQFKQINSDINVHDKKCDILHLHFTM